MYSDKPGSDERCKFESDPCPTGETCGMWIHNHDDRQNCVKKELCGSIGRLANNETRGDPEREFFTISCLYGDDLGIPYGNHMSIQTSSLFEK